MPAASAETVGGGRRPPSTASWCSAAPPAAARAIPRGRCARAVAARRRNGSSCAGTGTVYTFTVVRQAFIPSLGRQAPLRRDRGGARRRARGSPGVEPGRRRTRGGHRGHGRRGGVGGHGPRARRPPLPPRPRGPSRRPASAPMTAPPGRRAVIAGVATSDYPHLPHLSEHAVHGQAADRALADAGLTFADVDGFATTGFFPMYATGRGRVPGAASRSTSTRPTRGARRSRCSWSTPPTPWRPERSTWCSSPTAASSCRRWGADSAPAAGAGAASPRGPPSTTPCGATPWWATTPWRRAGTCTNSAPPPSSWPRWR